MIMDRAEICLLLPNHPLSFTDKVGQLRRRSCTSRCLFGPPDPTETQRLLQEMMQQERDRFQKRWNIDLDAIEAELEAKKNIPTAKVQELGERNVEESRIPPLPTEVAERLSSTVPQKEEKTSRSSSGYVPNTKRPAGCKKPCSKFQKRIRVAGHKRQTYLTEFWRSRRSISFVFGKSKPRPATLPLPESSCPTAPVLE